MIPKPTPEDMAVDLLRLKLDEFYPPFAAGQLAIKRARYAEAKLREALPLLRLVMEQNIFRHCRSCGSISGKPHFPDCKVAKLITELEAVYGKAE